MKVLVVEDDPVLGTVLQKNLLAHAYQASLVATAREGLEQIALDRPDVLVLDVNLPDSSGWDVLRRLVASDAQVPQTIVISAAPISRKRLEEFRPFAALRKPFTINALLNLLHAAETGGGTEPPLELPLE